MPCSCLTVPAGTTRARCPSPVISRSCHCRPTAQNSIRSSGSGFTCASASSRFGFSPIPRRSSRLLAAPGTPSPPTQLVSAPFALILGLRSSVHRLAGISPEIANWLRRQTPRTRRYGAIGTGAFLLGAAGLLDNKHVTTDWEFISVFAETFPIAIITPERTLVRDGAVFTSAAGTAVLDLTLSLIEE